MIKFRLDWLSRVGTFSFAFFLIAAMVPVLVVPANYFHLLRSPSLVKLADYSGLLFFVCAFGALTCFFISRLNFLVPSSSGHTVDSVAKDKNQWSWVVVGLCSLFVLFFSVRNLDSAMDWDELDTLSRMVSLKKAMVDENDPYHNANMFDFLNNTRVHLLANLASRVSLSFVGVSPFAARLPAVFFTVLLLLSVAFLAGPGENPFVRALVFLHVAANHLVLWYSHSMRGYMSMMATSTLCFAYLVRAVYSSKPALNPILTFVLFLLPLLTHTFGAFFSGLLFVSYLAWFYFNANSLRPALFKVHQRALISAGCAMPFIAFYLVKQALFLNRVGDFHSNVVLDFSSLLLPLSGFARFPEGYVLFGFVVLVFIFQIRQLWKHQSLESLFFVLSFTFFVFLIPLTKSPFFEPRFLLGFLIPAIYSVGKLATIFKTQTVRYFAQTFAVITFVIFPIYEGNDVPTPVISGMKEFHEFMTSVRQILPPNACVTTSGEADQSRFAETLYFYKPARKLTTECPVIYQLHFAHNWDGNIPLKIADNQRAKELLSDGKDRFLYLLTPISD